MARPGSGDTVNSGPAPKRREESEPGIAGNAQLKGENPLPDDRDRGETSSADRVCVDGVETARDRAG